MNGMVLILFFIIFFIVALIVIISIVIIFGNSDEGNTKAEEPLMISDTTPSSDHNSEDNLYDENSYDTSEESVDEQPKPTKRLYFVVSGTNGSRQQVLKRVANQYKREYGFESFDGITNKEFLEDFYTEMSEFEGQSVSGIEFTYEAHNPSSSIKVHIPDVYGKLHHIGYVDRSTQDQLKYELENNKVIEAYGEFTGGRVKYVDYDMYKDKDVVRTEETSRGFDIGITFENEINPDPPKPKLTDFMKYTKARKLTDTYVVIDFETTGFNASEDEIIQIGAIKYEGHQEVDHLSTFIKPKKKLPAKITEITGITKDDLENAPLIQDVLPKLLQFIDGFDLVAHNASFDMDFLLINIHKHELPYKKYRAIDTLPLARKHFSTQNHKLPTLKKHLKLNKYNSHSALDDCYVTAAVYKHCYDQAN